MKITKKSKYPRASLLIKNKSWNPMHQLEAGHFYLAMLQHCDDQVCGMFSEDNDKGNQMSPATGTRPPFLPSILRKHLVGNVWAPEFLQGFQWAVLETASWHVFHMGDQKNSQQRHRKPNVQGLDTALKRIFVFPRVNFTVLKQKFLMASWELLLELWVSLCIGAPGH